MNLPVNDVISASCCVMFISAKPRAASSPLQPRARATSASTMFHTFGDVVVVPTPCQVRAISVWSAVRLVLLIAADRLCLIEVGGIARARERGWTPPSGSGGRSAGQSQSRPDSG